MDEDVESEPSDDVGDTDDEDTAPIVGFQFVMESRKGPSRAHAFRLSDIVVVQYA